MRTDAKIGFAIGGVLLAVLAVYLIVVPKAKTKHDTKTVVALAHPADPVPDNATPGTGTPPVSTPPVSTPPVTVATNDPAPIPTIPPVEDHPNKPETVDTHTANNDSKFMPVEPIKPLDRTDELADNFGKPTGPAIDPMQSLTSGERAKTGQHRPSKRRDPAMTAERTVPTNEHATPVARQYTVKSGQTLSSIAADVYGNARFWVAIQRDNAGLDAKHLKVGQKINMPDITDVRPSGPVLVDVLETPTAGGGTEIEPTAHTYRVQSGDSLYKISKKLFGTGRRADAIYALNKDLIGEDDSKLKLGMLLKLPEGAHVAVTSAVQ